jgi:hypothetical protein
MSKPPLGGAATASRATSPDTTVLVNIIHGPGTRLLVAHRGRIPRDERYNPTMDQETRRTKIRDLIKAGTLPSYPSPADSVSGPAPCTACGTSGGKMKFERLPATLCHECAKMWQDLVKR